MKMFQLNDANINKSQKIAGYVFSILFSLQILVAGILKIAQVPDMVKNMDAIPKWEDKMVFIGVLELVLLVLYWYPKTIKFGFYLMCSFVGGIIVAEVAAGKPPYVGIMTAVFLYAGTLLRYPSMLR